MIFRPLFPLFRLLALTGLVALGTSCTGATADTDADTDTDTGGEMDVAAYLTAYYTISCAALEVCHREDFYFSFASIDACVEVTLTSGTRAVEGCAYDLAAGAVCLDAFATYKNSCTEADNEVAAVACGQVFTCD